jgi:hypothetical protein
MQWEDALADALARLPFEHLSTLVYLIRYESTDFIFRAG